MDEDQREGHEDDVLQNGDVPERDQRHVQP
jgi:hypothetical protein